MEIKEKVLKLKKEIKKSEKCKMCIQLNEDFGTDCPKHMKLKAKLQGYEEALAEVRKEVKKIRKRYGKESWGDWNELLSKIGVKDD